MECCTPFGIKWKKKRNAYIYKTNCLIKHNNSNSMLKIIVFSAILIGPLVKLNGFYTSIKTRAYEYFISALISQC